MIVFVHMYLDSFLPRVCELATSSSVRQTKVSLIRYIVQCFIIDVLG